MSTLPQIRKIHMLKNLLCLSDKEYKKMLRSFQVCSSKDLTETEANIFISVLDERVRILKLKKYDSLLGRSSDMATPLQLRKIEAIWKDICNDKSKENIQKTLKTYLFKHFHIFDMRFLTKVRAGRIISVLNKILLKKLEELNAN